jgi:hypothetical protein
MSELENQEVEQNPIEDFIDAIAQQNFNRAQEHFEDMLGDRVHDALEQEKIAVADTIFNEVDAELEDLDDEDIEDWDDETEVSDEEDTYDETE